MSQFLKGFAKNDSRRHGHRIWSDCCRYRCSGATVVTSIGTELKAKFTAIETELK